MELCLTILLKTYYMFVYRFKNTFYTLVPTSYTLFKTYFLLYYVNGAVLCIPGNSTLCTPVCCVTRPLCCPLEAEAGWRYSAGQDWKFPGWRQLAVATLAGDNSPASRLKVVKTLTKVEKLDGIIHIKSPYSNFYTCGVKVTFQTLFWGKEKQPG